ncbi:putative oxidoreductase glyr1 [Glugoides intestinalis]
MSLRFESGELVWAKMDGYPFWPGKIAQSCITEELKAVKGEEGMAILFFGKELTYGLVSKDFLEAFLENYDKYSSVDIEESMKDDFDAAIEFAKSGVSIEDPPLELDGDITPQTKKHKKNEKTQKASKHSTSKKDKESEDNDSDEESVLEEGSLESEDDGKEIKTSTEENATKIECSTVQSKVEISNKVSIEVNTHDNDVSMSTIDSESIKSPLENQNTATDLNIAK